MQPKVAKREGKGVQMNKTRQIKLILFSHSFAMQIPYQVHDQNSKKSLGIPVYPVLMLD